jgi:ATP diphosphatase
MARSILDEVAEQGASLDEGQELGRHAARVGFDWDTALQALMKVEEEVAELRMELEAGSRASHDDVTDRLEDEIGDVLFAVANVARKLDINAEGAMARTNAKFRERFSYIEARAAAEGRELTDLTLEEMESIWQSAK